MLYGALFSTPCMSCPGFSDRMSRAERLRQAKQPNAFSRISGSAAYRSASFLPRSNAFAISWGKTFSRRSFLSSGSKIVQL